MDRDLSSVPQDSASDSASEMQKRLAGYGMTALAITGAVASTTATAHAAVVIYSPTSPLTASINGPAVLFDFATGTSGVGIGSVATPQFALFASMVSQTRQFQTVHLSGTHDVPGTAILKSERSQAVILPATHSAGVVTHIDPAAYVPFQAQNFGFGQQIGTINQQAPANSQFFTHSVALLAGHNEVDINNVPYFNFKSGQFAPSPGSPEYGVLGLEFALPDGEHFGWADITLNPDFSVTLNRFGYETTPNTEILAPNVAPEASPLTLLLIGGPVALAAYRKLRRKDEPETVN